ncbi:SH3 domain-containing protein [Streptomyces sp. NPDC002309]
MSSKSARRGARRGGAAAVLCALAMTVGAAPAGAAAEQRPASPVFTTWATDVNVREDPSPGYRCPEFPSPGNCPQVAGRAQPGDRLEVLCQTRGETVGGNPYWVFVDNRTRGFDGWMASYYISHPDNWLPGVPQCYGP